MLKIDVWSDYACPYCYIGKKQLIKALEELEITDYTLHHKVYILEPGKVSRSDRTFIEGLNLSDDKARASMKATLQNITEMARKIGLDYHLDKMLDVGTVDAHRLTLWASEQGHQETLSNLIYTALLCEGKDISDHNFLADLAEQVGLSREGALKILDSPQGMEQVFEDFDEADDKDVELIPHFFFNDDYEIIGTTTVENLKGAIQDALHHT